MAITEDACSHCHADLRTSPGGAYSRMIAVVDRDLDCVVAHRCPDCGTEEPRPLAEVLAVADPAAFSEPRK